MESNQTIEQAVAEVLLTATTEEVELAGLTDETENGLANPPATVPATVGEEEFTEEDPAALAAVSHIIEGRILATLTDMEQKGKLLHQTERDATRAMQENLFAGVLAAVDQLTDQRTIIEIFRRACMASEAKWKELHGLDPRANLRAIDERTKSPVKLAAKYSYWKSVTLFGLGAPRKGETALRKPFPVVTVADGAQTVVSFDSWYSAVQTAYDSFLKKGREDARVVGKKGKPAEVQTKDEGENIPFVPGFNAESSRKALAVVTREHKTIAKLNELVRLAAEALELGSMSDGDIADTVDLCITVIRDATKDFLDRGRAEVAAQRAKDAARAAKK